MNPQDGPEHGGIGHVPVLASRRVAEGGRVTRVEPDTTVRGRLVKVFLPALALGHPVAGFHLLPLDRGGGVGLHWFAVGGMCERRRVGSGNADFMGYIDAKLSEAGCYG